MSSKTFQPTYKVDFNFGTLAVNPVDKVDDARIKEIMSRPDYTARANRQFEDSLHKLYTVVNWNENLIEVQLNKTFNQYYFDGSIYL